VGAGGRQAAALRKRAGELRRAADSRAITSARLRTLSPPTTADATAVASAFRGRFLGRHRAAAACRGLDTAALHATDLAAYADGGIAHAAAAAAAGGGGGGVVALRVRGRG
jgi:hypothetical protein